MDGLSDLGVEDAHSLLTLSGSEVNLEEMILDGGDFGGSVENCVSVGPYIAHVGVAGRDPFHRTEGVAKVKVAESVTVVGAIEEMVVLPDEVEGIRRLDVLTVVFGKDSADELSVVGPILVEPHVLLGTVENLDEDVSAVRTPGDVREVPVFTEVGDIHVYGLARCLVDGLYEVGSIHRVEDSEAYPLGIHSVHRVFDVDECSRPCRNVEKGEVRHLGLVVAVEGDLVPVRGKENTAVDSELVAADALTVFDLVVLGLYDDDVPISVLPCENSVTEGDGRSSHHSASGEGDASVGELTDLVLGYSGRVDVPRKDGLLHGEDLSGRIIRRMGLEDSGLRRSEGGDHEGGEDCRAPCESGNGCHQSIVCSNCS